MIGMSDGCSDRFDILANGNYKIVNVNEADYLQKYVAVKDRELFILCRNRFFELMNRK
jgi:hypothetical protein